MIVQKSIAWTLLTSCCFTAAALAPLAAAAQSFNGGHADGVVAKEEDKSPKYKTKKGDKASPLKPDRIIRARNGLEPSWGNIRTFWGDNTPFWGNIRTFWGDVSPFEGDLSAFWGNIRTFNDGTTGNDVAPQWGNIRTFAGDIGASWGNIRTFWGGLGAYQDTPDGYAQLAGQMQGMVNQSSAFWSESIQAQTGKSFMDGFGEAVLDKYGIDLNRPETLAALDINTREHFFLEWNDGLMEFSGADHVDHWMKEINWTPALTETLGEGAKTKIGLLDFSVTGDESRSVTVVDGVSTVANGHGTAVASLLVAAHDGRGVMGIAPKASVIAYNPFDASNTAGWTDIRNGIVMLARNGASVINMSLGVPNWTLNPDWNPVFTDRTVRDVAKNAVFVIAAGNDGYIQDRGLTWAKDNPAFIVVGSVDPTGTISSFSNKPGSACLLDGDKCTGDYLMNHFIVAPGELILVSDGKGGVTRLSGTSFAAPLVSGTIALIHDRWPWYVRYPKDTVGIILKSAKDLGAPGVDPIYGVGELDVQAALSPLSFDKLQYKMVIGGKVVSYDVKALRATTSVQRATWEPLSAYISAFEKTGDTQRDFQIPLSSKLANQTVAVNGDAEQFMGYLTNRFSTWLGAPTRFTGGPRTLGFVNSAATTTSFTGASGAETTLTMAPRASRLGFRSSEVPYQSTLRVVSPDQRFSFETGQGDAAPTVAGAPGFGLSSDYDVTSGGANPFIGLASGGAYARVEVSLSPHLSVATAVTQRTLKRDLDGLTPDARQALASYDPYRANAATMTARYQASSALSASLGYTVLHEGEAVLGMQSRDDGDLPQGSTTDAVTLGADLAVANGFVVSASGTMGRTRAGDPSVSAIAVGPSGLVSSAFQVVAGKEHLVDRNDRIRVSFAQPMHVEGGSLAVTDVGVIDRQTGEIGAIVRHSSIVGGRRRYVAEMIYGRAMGAAAEVSLFGRANVGADNDPDLAGFTGGLALTLGL